MGPSRLLSSPARRVISVFWALAGVEHVTLDDICVLGTFQVSATGDLANWSTGEAGAIPAVGGAMDLAVGAKRTWMMMELLTKDRCGHRP